MGHRSLELLLGTMAIQSTLQVLYFNVWAQLEDDGYLS